MLLDGQHTGRYRWDQLHKTEKTHAGTLVEIALARTLRLADGVTLDYTIAGAEVDCKFSHRLGGWMIPPEADGKLLLLVQASDEDGTWSAGLIRATAENLRPAGNRDGKRALNERGRAAVRWLQARASLQENALIRLPERDVAAIFALPSGQQRVNELFRRAQRMRVSRTVVATVAMQDDYMKRVRSAGYRQQAQRLRNGVGRADVAGQVALHGRADRRHQVLGGRRGQGLQAEHIPGETETDDLAGDQRGPVTALGVVTEPGHLDQAGQDRAGHELAQHGDPLLAGRGGPEQPEECRPDVGHVPSPQHRRGQDLADARLEFIAESVPLRTQGERYDLARHHRQPHRGGEQPFLGPVEVMYQRRIDSGVGRDAADRRPVVPLLAEAPPRGLEDGLAGPALTGPPAWSAPGFVGCHPIDAIDPPQARRNTPPAWRAPW
jgi:hypothetical protein